MDGQVSEVEGLGRVVRRGLSAFADKELAEAPAYEAGVRVEAGEAVLGIESGELAQELGRFGAGAGEDGVDEAEDGREGVSLVQLEEPAAGLPADGTHCHEIEELLVLLNRAIDGEQALQGGGIEMLVLHAFLSF